MPTRVPHLNPSIAYVDDALIVADKPAGLLSIPARGEDRQDCLELRVQALYADALIAHRLDMGTSGLVLFARGARMLRQMSLAFERRLVGKRYQALVHGHIENDSGDIGLPLAEDPENRPRQRVDALNGRHSLTRYRVVMRGGQGANAFTRVELEPLTGRTHQLRVHLMSIGHPILGDPLYAAPESAECHARMALHAAEIAFIHPRTQVPIVIASAVPF